MNLITADGRVIVEVLQEVPWGEPWVTCQNEQGFPQHPGDIMSELPYKLISAAEGL